MWGGTGPYAVALSQSSRAGRVGFTLGRETAGGQACWGPGFTGQPPLCPRRMASSGPRGWRSPPAFAAAGVWARGWAGQSPPGLREGTSLGQASDSPQEGPPTTVWEGPRSPS